MDEYVEYMVAKERNPKAVGIRYALIAAGAFLIIASIGIGLIFIIPGVGLIVAGYFAGLKEFVEYEYLILEKELTIDRICNHSNRKRIADYALAKSEVIAPSDSERLKEYDNIPVLDYTSGSGEGDMYDVVTEGVSGKLRIRIETNDEMRKALRASAPSRFFNN